MQPPTVLVVAGVDEIPGVKYVPNYWSTRTTTPLDTDNSPPVVYTRAAFEEMAVGYASSRTGSKTYYVACSFVGLTW